MCKSRPYSGWFPGTPTPPPPRNGKTLYYHPVLEAKLINSNGFAFSLITEFIENPGDKVTKQDCNPPFRDCL